MSGMVENRNLMHRLPTRQLDSMNASCGSSIRRAGGAPRLRCIVVAAFKNGSGLNFGRLRINIPESDSECVVLRPLQFDLGATLMPERSFPTARPQHPVIGANTVRGRTHRLTDGVSSVIEQSNFNRCPQMSQFLAVLFPGRTFDLEEERHLSLLSLTEMEHVLTWLIQGEAL